MGIESTNVSRPYRSGAVLLAAGLLSLLLAASALAAVGALTQKPGTAGCISESGTGGACGDGTALGGANSVTVSPDGENAYVASQFSNAVAIFDRDPTNGGLTQKPGSAGCISDTGTAGSCVNGRALSAPYSVTVSPDGKNAYVASADSNAVAIFDRDPTTGALTQKNGSAGCVSAGGADGACGDGRALITPVSITVSPDGKSAYVASRTSSAVAIFDRNPTSGALTQKPTTAGCISETGTAGACVDGVGLEGAQSVTVSPDGKSAYVTSINGDAVAIFDRNPTTGALTQKPTTAGCISETGTGGACTDGVALDYASSVTVSPDGRNAYVASVVSDAVAIFDRNPTTGALTQKPTTAGCISETGTGGVCDDGTALSGSYSVTVSPDGNDAYVASGGSAAVAIFDRDATTGALTQKPGSAGCISDTGTAGSCVDGTALVVPLSVTVSPDGSSAYVTSYIGDAVAIFDRDIPPETTITKQPKKKLTTNKKKVRVKVSFSSEPGVAFRCHLDMAQFKPCSSPFIVKAKSKPGKGKKHSISIHATDEAGDGETKPATATFRVIRKR